MNTEIKKIQFQNLFYRSGSVGESVSGGCKIVNKDIDLDEKTIRLYFDECFEDLSFRVTDKIVSKNVFCCYLQFPIFFSERLFLSLDKGGKGSLNKEEFSKGMYELFFGSLQELMQLFYQIFKSNNSGKILKADVELIFTYLEAFIIQEYGEKYVNKKTERGINSIFKENAVIEGYETFRAKMLNESSDLFFTLLIYINLNKTYTKESLLFFKEHCFKEKYVGVDVNADQPDIIMTNYDEDNVINDLICMPSKDILNCLNNNLIFDEKLKFSTDLLTSKIKGSFGSNADSLEDDSEQDKFSFGKEDTSTSLVNTIYSAVTSNTASNSNHSYHFNHSNQSNHSNHSNHSSNELPHHFEEIIYKFSKENTIRKFKIMLIEKDLYCFKFSKESNEWVYNNVHPLRGYHIAATSQETAINSEKFLSFVLMNQFGNSLASIGKFFFTRKRRVLENCIKRISEVLKIRYIEDHYSFVHDLRTGQFASIKLGLNRRTKEKFAIKTLDKNKIKDKDLLMVLNEIDIVRFFIGREKIKINESNENNEINNFNENVIKFFDVFEDKNFIYIVMEYLSGDNLKQFIYNYKQNINESLNKRILKQIAKGLNFLNKFGIVHRDIKLENIMLGIKPIRVLNDPFFNLNIKIIDFGLSKILGKEDLTQEKYGTLLYTSPEILSSDFYSHKVDVWSFGVLAHYLTFGLFPFDGTVPLSQIYKKIINDDLILPEVSVVTITGEIRELIVNCLEKSKVMRWDISQVVDSKWLC